MRSGGLILRRTCPEHQSQQKTEKPKKPEEILHDIAEQLGTLNRAVSDIPAAMSRMRMEMRLRDSVWRNQFRSTASALEWLTELSKGKSWGLTDSDVAELLREDESHMTSVLRGMGNESKPPDTDLKRVPKKE